MVLTTQEKLTSSLFEVLLSSDRAVQDAAIFEYLWNFQKDF